MEDVEEGEVEFLVDHLRRVDEASSRKWKRPERDDIVKVEREQVLGSVVGEWQGVGTRVQRFIVENWEELDKKMTYNTQ